MDFYKKFFRYLYRTIVLFWSVGVSGVGTCSDHRRKHPAVAGAGGAGCAGCVLLSDQVFLSGIVCVLHVDVFGVSYYMEKFKPGGGWCSVFVEKTNKEKKTRKRVKKFYKKC